MKVVLACDTLDRTNWGCRATSSAMRRLLGEHADLTAIIEIRELARRTPGMQQSAGSLARGDPIGVWGQEESGSIWSQQTRRIRARVRGAPRLRIPDTVADLDATWWSWRHDPLLADWVAALEDADAVVINGEGAVRRRNASGRLAFFVAWAAADMLGKPTAIVNHMCDLGDPVMAAFAERVYPIMGRAVFRDPVSLARGETMCTPGAASFAPDAAFIHEPSARDAFVAVAARSNYFGIYPNDASALDVSRPYICLGGGAQFQDGTELSSEFVAWFESVALALAANVQVVLLGHDHPDHRMMAFIANRTGLPFLGVQTPVPQVVDVLAHSALYVGGRWHSAIMTAIGRTPTLQLSSNSRVKDEGLRQLLGLGRAPLAIECLPSPTVVAATAMNVMADDGLRVAMQERLADVAHAARAHAMVALHAVP